MEKNTIRVVQDNQTIEFQKIGNLYIYGGNLK